jgi:hypothetical protein
VSSCDARRFATVGNVRDAATSGASSPRSTVPARIALPARVSTSQRSIVPGCVSMYVHFVHDAKTASTCVASPRLTARRSIELARAYRAHLRRTTAVRAANAQRVDVLRHRSGPPRRRAIEHAIAPATSVASSHGSAIAKSGSVST